MAQHLSSYGTVPHHRDAASGDCPVELRRVGEPPQPITWSTISAGTSGICQSRQTRQTAGSCAHGVVAQVLVAPARQAGHRGCKSAGGAQVDRPNGSGRRSTKPEHAGSSPAVDANSPYSAGMRAPPSEGGGRTFESCRRGASLPGSDPAGSGACPENRYGREPLWVRVPPLPRLPQPRWSIGHDTGPSTRRAGFESPSRNPQTADAR